MSNFKTKLHTIKAFAFDVDGVFTDGLVIATETGDLLRSHNAKDGFAVRIAVLKNYPVAIITGGSSESIRKRFLQVGVQNEDIYLRSLNKMPDFDDFCSRNGLKHEEVLYMGDDIPDIEVLNACGIATCPSDAVTEVKEVCEYISLYPGGRGSVRDVIEQTLKVQDSWSFDQEIYSGL